MDQDQRQATVALNSQDKRRVHVERKAFPGLTVLESYLAVLRWEHKTEWW
jgi:hypothetical protein